MAAHRSDESGHVTDLDEVRTQIDALDRRIVALIAERQTWVETAGALKSDASAVPAPHRVEQVIAKVRALAEGSGASPDIVERAYRALIAGFIELELEQHASSSNSTPRARKPRETPGSAPGNVRASGSVAV